MSGRILVAPSMLAADFGRLAEETHRMEVAGADWIHLDVMDGHFVPNLTIGPLGVAALRPATRLPLDVHLMIENPEKYIPFFIEAGADRVTFHAEACLLQPIGKAGLTQASLRQAAVSLTRVVKAIRQRGAKVGVAVRPETGIELIKPVLEEIDLALLMTVNPGFGGQAFIREVLPKIEALRKVFDRHIQVDGGINHETARETQSAGADVMVAGTYIFRAADCAQAIAALKGQASPPTLRPIAPQKEYMA